MAANQLAAWAEGRLPLSVRPTPCGMWTSASVRNGRGRPMRCLRELHTTPSVNAMASKNSSTQIRPRAPPFQIISAQISTTAGMKKRLPLTNGIRTSNTGLLNVGFTQWNSPASRFCSQCVKS